MNLQTGAFGDPASTETLILFWTRMEQLHYPGAGETRAFLERRLAEEQRLRQAQLQMQVNNMAAQRAANTAQAAAQAISGAAGVQPGGDAM